MTRLLEARELSAFYGPTQVLFGVELGVDDGGIEDLIAEIDERLVLTTDPHREDFIVTVWRGAKAGVFSEELDDEEEDTNGASPAR